MKKNYKLIVKLTLILVLGLALYSYFHVAGNEIDGVLDISSTCFVTITKGDHLMENKKEYTLDESQIEMLKTLLLNSSFTRNLSSVVRIYDRDKYFIRIDFKNNQDVLLIDCNGNEYISVTNQFNGKHLNIKNKNWKNSLEEIISLSRGEK